MKIATIIMAGGKGLRLRLTEEKPLIKICGKAMIDYVIHALKESKKVGKIVVAVSKYTLRTAKKLRNLGIDTIETSGENYVLDMQDTIRKCGFLGPVLIISSDLPLITGSIIDEIIDCFQRCSKPALTIVARAKTLEELGLTYMYSFRFKDEKLVPVGINIIEGRHIDKPELEEEVLITDRLETIVNVNSTNDLKLAEKLLRSRRSIA